MLDKIKGLFCTVLLLFSLVLALSCLVSAAELTFGKTSVGGSNDGFGEAVLIMCKYASPSDFGTITKFSAYFCAASGTLSATPTIYSDSGGVPSLNLANGTQVTGITDTPGWHNFTISYAGSPSTVYWLGIHTSANPKIYYDTGTANQAVWRTDYSYPNNPSPWDTDNDNFIAMEMSIYAVYTAASGITGASIATNTTVAGQVSEFSTYWTSQSGNCDFYIFGTNNTGPWVNDTATSFSGSSTTDWSNITKTLNTTVGVIVEWRIWANNTAGTWGNIALQYVTTTNQIAVSSVGRSTSLALTSCTFYAYWTTVSGTLDAYIFGTNNTGVWVNDTKADFAGTPTAEWSNVTKTLNATAGYVVQWQIWANNTGGANVNTGLQSFTLTTWASEKYTVYASSGSRQAIQEAVDDVRANGDNGPEKEGQVIVPYGAWTLDATGGIGGSTSLYAVGTIYWYVQSWGGIDIIGEGMYDTNLTLLPNDDTYEGVAMFFINGTNQKPCRVSGISFKGRIGTATATGDNAVVFDSAKDYRVDHCSFSNMGSTGVSSTCSIHANTARGVVDHCNFTAMYKPDAETAGTGYGYGVGVERSYQKGSDMQNILWDSYGSASQFLGTYGNVTYIEGCYFQGCRHAIVAYACGAYVSRFNTFTEMWVPYGSGWNDVHGAYPDGTYGGRYFEVYNNTFYQPPGTNPYDGDSSAHATRSRGGSGVVFYNTIVNYTYAFGITADDGNDAYPKCKISNLYFWSNTLTNTTQFDLTENYDTRVLGTHYFTNAPTSFTYVAYQYPHPLTQTEEGIIVMLLNPNATIYYSPTIPVQISAQGGTIDKIWWNCKNSTAWIYGSNQTYTATTSMTGFVNGTSYTFYAWANNTLGVTAEKTQEFTVEINDLDLLRFYGLAMASLTNINGLSKTLIAKVNGVSG